MSKRRRGNQSTHYQVPSLKSLALHQVRVNSGNTFRHNWNQFKKFTVMDSEMSDASSSRKGPMNPKKSDAVKGALEAGAGLEVTIPRAIPHIFNNNYTVRLTYADNYRLVFNYGANATQYWRMNSIFDPDVTGIGHQPCGKDLWSSMYDYYSVLACHYKIRIYNGYTDSLETTATGTAAQRVGCANITLLPTTNTADIVANTTVYPVAEMKNTQTIFLTPESMHEFSGTLTPGDFLIDAKDADTDSTWTAVGSNPTVSRYLAVVATSAQWAAFAGQSETPWISCMMQVILDYDVQFAQVNTALRAAAS